MSKTQKQTIALGVVIGLIVIALIGNFIINRPSAATNVVQYEAPKIQKNFSSSVFDNPEYLKLEPPLVKLPLDPGPKGNEDPYGGGSDKAGKSVEPVQEVTTIGQ